MWDKLITMEKRFEELESQMAKPEVAADPEQLRKLGQERAALEDVITKYRQYKTTEHSLKETRAILQEGNDEEHGHGCHTAQPEAVYASCPLPQRWRFSRWVDGHGAYTAVELDRVRKLRRGKNLKLPLKPPVNKGKVT